MKTNFELVSNTTLTYGDHNLDVRDGFDMVSFEYSPRKRKLTITLNNILEDGTHDLSLGFRLVHLKVSYLSISQGDADSNIANETFISEITYSPSDLRDMTNSIINQTLPEKSDDIIYFFDNGNFIRVECEEIELIPLDEKR
jgi:hypothetical protein